MPKVKLSYRHIQTEEDKIKGVLSIETKFDSRIGTLPNLLFVNFSGTTQEMKIERGSTSKIVNNVKRPYDVESSQYADFIERTYSIIEGNWTDIYLALLKNKFHEPRVEITVPLEKNNRIGYCIGGTSYGKRTPNHINDRDDHMSSGSKH